MIAIPGGRLERALRDKARRFLKSQRGLRKPELRDIFSRAAYIFPGDLRVENYPRRPVVAFNPGAILRGDRLWMFPRLVFDYYNYTSSIGFIEAGISDVVEGALEKPLGTRVILWPKYLWEFKGCEDARVHREGDRYLLLYTGYGYMVKGDALSTSIVQGLAVFDSEFKETGRGYFTIAGDEERFLPRAAKDSVIITVRRGEAVMLSRPTMGDVDICWRSRADLGEPCFLGETMEPVLANEEWEFKVGWSTNAVKLSSNEYLVGWHGVLREDYSYRNGIAVVDEEGDLLAISNYLLAPKGIVEEYGDRPLVVFGNGLVRYRELLVWVGGISDYAMAIFTAELEKVMETLKWIRG